MHYAYIYIYIYRINQIGNESAKLTSMKKLYFSFHFILSKSIHPSIYIALSKIKIRGFGFSLSFSFSFDPLFVMLIKHMHTQTGETPPNISIRED